MSGLARLVLNKQALCGLKVLFWHNELGKELDGVIEAYDQAQDSFVLFDESSGAQYAVHFHQFTVEEEQQQLVLRVTSCTLLPVPQRYRASRLSVESDDGSGLNGLSELRASDSTSLTGLDRAPSTQLSAEMSQQLSGLIGRSFSGTTEGFAPVLGNTQAIGMGSESDEESYWGSPLKQQATAKTAADSAALGAAADISEQDATALAAASNIPPELAAVAAADGQAAEPQAAAGEGGLQQIAEADHLPLSAAGEGLVTAGQGSRSGTTSVASLRGSPAPSAGQITPVPLSSVGGSSEDLAAQAAHPASHSSSFNSFQEISRIISKDEPKAAGSPIPIMKQGSKHRLGPAAARLFDEITTWGTPGDSSPNWGTPPREQHMVELVAPADEQSSSAQAEAARRLDMPTAADEAGPSWSPEADAKVDDVPHESTSSTFVAAVPVATAPRVRFSEASDGGGDSDFTIAAGIDVQYRPASRTATRNTQLYRLSIPEATDDGMMVDIPQPLSTRRASRTSVRNMYLASDPGTASASSGVPLAELRRATSNMGGLLTSRRISRTTSGRVQDQDWAMGTETAQQQLPAWPMSPSMVLTANGVPVHVPGPASRRISRTLSGRPPADQFGVADTAVLSEDEDDDAPDVLARPSTASAIALEVISSRRESSAGGRPGTPDSDGFGFSEFEGLEPLVPPEISQWDAIAEEAVVHASEATTPAAHSHRHQRRSMRSIGGPQTVPSTPSGSRPNQRVSDQDDHIPLSPLRAALPSDWVQHAITGRALTPVSEQQGAGSSQTEPHQQLGGSAILVGQQQQRPIVGGEAADSQPSEQSTTPGSAVTRTSSDAAADPAGTSALESPRLASGMPGADELKRVPSKKPSLTGMLQKAAAAVVGSVFTGNKGTTAEQQTAPEDGEGMTQQPQATDNPSAAQAAEDRLPFRPQFKAHLAGDSLASGDSFNCPPFMPMIGGSNSSKSNPFADPASSAFQIGTAVADAADSEQFAPGSLINKQLLPASDSLAAGSDWGSGSFAAQITSGIDTPTGSGIFKTNPFAEGSSYSSASPQGSGGLDGFPSVPGPSRAGIGASRMGREAAAVTAATVPFSGLAADSISSKSSGANISEITPASEDEAVEHKGAYSNAAAGVQQHLGFDSSTRATQGLGFEEQTAAGLSSDGSTWRRRSSEPDSGGAEADDERTPLAAESLLSHFTARSSRDSDGGTRAAAELDHSTSVAPAAAARGSVDADSTASPVGSSGLVRRAASRTASQQLPGNVTVSLDGMVVLPQPNYQYGDDDQQPLMQQHAGGVGYSAGKVRGVVTEDLGDHNSPRDVHYG